MDVFAVIEVRLAERLAARTWFANVKVVGRLVQENRGTTHSFGARIPRKVERESLYEEALMLTQTDEISTLPSKKVDVEEVKEGSADRKEDISKEA